MGDYVVPVYYLLSHIVKEQIIIPPKITQKTIELGVKHSPEFVCMPFKFTLGTFIECLEEGANILVQAGGGCRYGYYAELQEEILKELGYDFTYVNLVSKGKMNTKEIKNQLQKIGITFSKRKTLYYVWITSKMIKYMDKLDFYIRENIGFEQKKGSFEKTKGEMLKSFVKTKSYIHLFYLYQKYKHKLKKIPKETNRKKYKVGVIGELYTLMEPSANYHIEYELAKYGVSVKRYTNVYYLLFQKKNKIKKYLKKTKEYITYKMGADAADNIARCKYLCQKKYDGIIHMKSSFCTPEIGAMPILNKICKEYDVPIIYFSFDAATSEVGIKTRIEAFCDMIEMRKKK